MQTDRYIYFVVNILISHQFTENVLKMVIKHLEKCKNKIICD